MQVPYAMPGQPHMAGQQMVQQPAGVMGAAYPVQQFQVSSGCRLPCPTVPGLLWAPPTLSNSSRSVVGAAYPVPGQLWAPLTLSNSSRSVVGAAYPVRQFQVSCGRRLSCPLVTGR